MIYVYIIFGLLVVIILFVPLKIRVIRNDRNNDIDLYLVKFFNVRLDIDQALRQFATSNNRIENSPVGALYDFIKVYQSRNFISSVLGLSRVQKITIILKHNSKNEDLDVLYNIVGWIGISYLRSLIHKHFKVVKNEYYMVDSQSSSGLLLNIEIIFHIRIIFFLFSIFVNIKELPKLIKTFKKGSETNE